MLLIITQLNSFHLLMFFPVFQLEVHLTNSHLQELTVSV